jgi:exodeoxyribonuclease V gamma subunit
VVQNQGMTIWLKQLIARKTGISCNISFPFLNGFINQILEECLTRKLDREYFHPYIMKWKINEILSEKASQFPDLSDYLSSGEKDLKKFQLSEQIANCFDQYQIYRPQEILQGLRRVRQYPWQAELYRILSAGKIDRSTGFQQFLQLENCQYLEELHRISIVGIFSMPPVFVDFFQHLAKFITVNIYLPFPVDLKKLKNIYSGTIYQVKYERKTEINPLLETIGKAGLEFSHLLRFTDSHFCPVMKEKPTDTLLSIFQNSLQNSTPAPRKMPKEKISTIQLHNCHSKMREAEVLHNNILHLIDKENILPSEILVMMPDIAAYSPYIKAVFDREDILSDRKNQKIPYTITDNTITFETPVDKIFLQLLNCHNSRFEATFVLDLLEKEAIYKKLQLTVEDLELIHKWIADTNIRWGLNGDQREKEFDLIHFDENSWEKGLNRMFLGFCIKDDDYPKLHYSYLPYDQFEGHHNFILGKISAFISRLDNLHREFQQPATIIQWQQKLYQLIDDFFYDSGDFQKDLKLLRKKVATLTEIAEMAEVKSNITIQVLQQYFQEELSDEFQTNRYFRGGVTFSTLQPLRNIPAKVICIIGMNDNEFPRSEHLNSFNFISQETRCGDRIKREEDQYLFLEALLSARNFLIISYIGQSIKTNEISEPASPVCELRDYLKKLFSDDIMKKIYYQHKLQSHNSLYFTDPTKKYFSYSKQDFLSQKKILTKDFYTGPLKHSPEFEEIYLDDLIRHLSNPARFFAENILEAKLEYYETDIHDAENFTLNSLEKYKVNQFILTQMIKNNTPDFIYDILKAKDDLPVSHTGKQIFDAYYEDLENFLKTDIDELNASLLEALRNHENVSVDFEFKGIRIFGTLPPVHGGHQLYFRYANFKGKDALKSWIYHLIGNLSQKSVETLTITKDKVIRYPQLSQELAKNKLSKILILYKKMHRQPLPFFPDTGLKFLTHNPKNKKSKNDAAKEAFSGFYNKKTHEKIPGEGENPYIQLFFSENILYDIEFEECTKIILSPFAMYFETDDGYQALRRTR